MNTPSLSLIIPAYNEARRIGQTLQSVDRYCEAEAITCEILAVLDGCTDATADIVEECASAAQSVRIRSIVLPENRGKGAAVKRGILESKGTIVGFTDADLPYGIESLKTVFDIFEDDSSIDMVIGGRDLPASSYDHHALPAIRRVSGKIYAILVQSILRTGIPDTQCGFKFFRAEIARLIFSKVTIDGFGFDVEAIHIAHINDFGIERLPVTLINEGESSVQIVRDSADMFAQLFLIRLRDLRRGYSLAAEKTASAIPKETPYRD